MSKCHLMCSTSPVRKLCSNVIHRSIYTGTECYYYIRCNTHWSTYVHYPLGTVLWSRNPDEEHCCHFKSISFCVAYSAQYIEMPYCTQFSTLRVKWQSYIALPRDASPHPSLNCNKSSQIFLPSPAEERYHVIECPFFACRYISTILSPSSPSFNQKSLLFLIPWNT